MKADDKKRSKASKTKDAKTPLNHDDIQFDIPKPQIEYIAEQVQQFNFSKCDESVDDEEYDFAQATPASHQANNTTTQDERSQAALLQ